MDTVGTFGVAETFSKHKLITCLHKHYTVEEVTNWGSKVDDSVLENIAISAGVNDRDYKKVD